MVRSASPARWRSSWRPYLAMLALFALLGSACTSESGRTSPRSPSPPSLAEADLPTDDDLRAATDSLFARVDSAECLSAGMTAQVGLRGTAVAGCVEAGTLREASTEATGEVAVFLLHPAEDLALDGGSEALRPESGAVRWPGPVLAWSSNPCRVWEEIDLSNTVEAITCERETGRYAAEVRVAANTADGTTILVNLLAESIPGGAAIPPDDAAYVREAAIALTEELAAALAKS